MRSKWTIAKAYWAARRPRKPARPAPEGPVRDQREMEAGFAEWNALGLTIDEARAAARTELETGKAVHAGYSIGLSSGTTGEPGVFVTTQGERDRWLGTILGKFLSPLQLPGLRAALLLRYNNALYGAGGRVHFFNIAEPVAAWAERLCVLAPNVVIGPPSALQAVAGTAAFLRRPVRPHTLLSAGEALFPQDRERLRAAYGVAPRNLYQAREGFLAAGCAGGALHWNEDLLVLEGMRFRGRRDRVVPVITDFTRESQQYARYRLDDLLVMGDEGPCGCRTPFQKAATVEGRLQDVVLVAGRNGAVEPRFPLELNAILYDGGEYRLTQYAMEHFRLECAWTPAAGRLRELGMALGRPGRLEIVPLRSGVAGEKRRRFRRLFDTGNRRIVEELLEPVGPI